MTTVSLDRLFNRGITEIIIREELLQKLESGRKLRLKLGFDPSKPDLHIGHAVVLRKIRQFQDLGHQVVLIVGDWTAQIGDPSGRDESRQMLTPEEVQVNAQTYMDQFFIIVDRENTEVRWQSEWFDDFSLTDVFRLTSRFTVAQMMQHETFRKRYEEGHPLSLMELLYPVLQAYDSVAVEADVEFGGTDQKFNILTGRELQVALGLPPQDVVLCPLLAGTDGRKMSKSFGNTIDLTTRPVDMYGRVMSIDDTAMLDYLELATDIPNQELAEIRQALSAKEAHPMEVKKRLARVVVTMFHGATAAQKAEGEFERVVQLKEIPSEVPTWTLEEPLPLDKVLSLSNTTPSTSQARRLIKQRAVSIDGQIVTDPRTTIDLHPGQVILIQAGKRRFLQVKAAQDETSGPGRGSPRSPVGERK